MLIVSMKESIIPAAALALAAAAFVCCVPFFLHLLLVALPSLFPIELL